ncbi:MAG: hypothetical protein IPG12_04840 [Saprospiraceae bacterium]|nr:hypothetical protein [Saprospiraceae bacterium]
MKNKRRQEVINPFESIESAQNKLLDFQSRFNFDSRSKEEILNNFLRGNILRAFSIYDIKPATIFRNWARLTYDDFEKEIIAAESYEMYSKYIDLKVNDLLNYWNSQMNNDSQKLIYGPASKIVNLLAKDIHKTFKIKNNQTSQFLHIPLDQYTLVPLKEIVNQLVNLNYKINFPTNATMSYINAKDHYHIIQNAIKNLTNPLGISPIIYEYMCWDDRH